MSGCLAVPAHGALSIGAEQCKAQAPDSFEQWLEDISPNFTWGWQHLQHIRQHLDAITNGTLKRLVITVPPRHGKSEMGTIRYPVFRLQQDPAQRVVIAAYSQTLANTFSRKARRIAQDLSLIHI